MKAKQKKMLIRIIIASVLLIALALSPITGYLRLALFLIPYFIVGYDILLKAAKGFTNGRIFDENLLMTVATLGAIAIALYDNTGDYTEAVAVMLFYPNRRMVPRLCGGQKSKKYQRVDGHSTGLRQYRKRWSVSQS